MKTSRLVLPRQGLMLTLLMVGSWSLVSCGPAEIRGEPMISDQSEESPTPMPPATEEEAKGETIPECPPRAVFEEPKAIETALPSYRSVRNGCDHFRPPVVRFVVSVTGAVTDDHLIRGTGCEDSDQLILSYVKKWRYEPATCDSKEIAQEVILTVRWGN